MNFNDELSRLASQGDVQALKDLYALAERQLAEGRHAEAAATFRESAMAYRIAAHRQDISNERRASLEHMERLDLLTPPPFRPDQDLVERARIVSNVCDNLKRDDSHDVRWHVRFQRYVTPTFVDAICKALISTPKQN